MYNGEPTVLVTSAEHYGAVINLDFDYEVYLNKLQDEGLNYTRIFSGFFVEFQGWFGYHNKQPLSPANGRLICPWKRSSTPGYKGGGNKFDLNQWDNAYFNRLKDFVQKAANRGIIVEYTFFCQMYVTNNGLSYPNQLWHMSPMWSGNNINGVGNIDGAEVLKQTSGSLFEKQKALIRKVVTELYDYDNVFYEIANEPGNPDPVWNDAMINAIYNKETNLGNKRHLIAICEGGKNRTLNSLNSRVDIVNYHYAYSSWKGYDLNETGIAKNFNQYNVVFGEDETGVEQPDPTDEHHYRREGWEALLNGCGLYNNLDTSFITTEENGLSKANTRKSSGGPVMRDQIKILKDFIESFNYVKMAPKRSIIKGGVPSGARASALVETGKQYAIFIRGGSQANLTVQLPSGTYTAKWIDTTSGNVVKTHNNFQHGGGNKTLSSPNYGSDGDIGLEIRSSSAQPPQAFIYENNFSNGGPADDFNGAVTSFDITGGKLVSNTPNVYKKIDLKGAHFPSNADDFKIVAKMKKGSASGWKGPSLRVLDKDTSNWYELRIRNNSGKDVEVYGKSGGQVVSKQWNANLNASSYNVFSLVVANSSLDVYVNNDFYGSVSVNNSGGKVGLRQLSGNAFWDYYRVLSLGGADYLEDFDDNSAQGWSYSTNNFSIIGSGDKALKQKAGSSWSFATYNAVVSVDANYRVAVEGKVTGTRVKKYDSPVLVLKYVNENNWIYVYQQQSLSNLVSDLYLKKKVAGQSTLYKLPSTSSLDNVDVTQWHKIEAKVDGTFLSVWVNDNLEAYGVEETALAHQNFNGNTQAGVRSPTGNVRVEYDNFEFFDEYN